MKTILSTSVDEEVALQVRHQAEVDGLTVSAYVQQVLRVESKRRMFADNARMMDRLGLAADDAMYEALADQEAAQGA